MSGLRPVPAAHTKKARLGKARRLLIVPFKTKLLYNFFGHNFPDSDLAYSYRIDITYTSVVNFSMNIRFKKRIGIKTKMERIVFPGIGGYVVLTM